MSDDDVEAVLSDIPAGEPHDADELAKLLVECRLLTFGESVSWCLNNP